MSFWKWSRTASANAGADGSINWAEGMAPSAVNDSARAMMAAAAKYRDDIAGALATGGGAGAYTLASWQGFDSLANMNGAMLAFTPHVTSAAAPTLNVDGLGARPIRSAPSADLPAGVLIQGTPYAATYFNATGEWILQGFHGNPYNVPLGGMLEYTGTAAPNSAFVLPFGQAISRTVYAAYFALVGTTYGAGDGTSTFNVIDKRGRVSAGKDDMGGSVAGRLTAGGSGIAGATLGATGGAETHTLTTAQMPAHNHSITITDPGHTHTGTAPFAAGANYASGPNPQAAQITGTSPIVINSNTTGITATSANAGSNSAHNNVQPTVIVNHILRIL
jgi:microcystin-dependent protein